MSFNDPYASGETVYAKSAGNITVSGAGAAPLTLVVRVDGEYVTKFATMPHAGVATVYLRELLVSLSDYLELPFDLSKGASGTVAVKVVTIEAGASTWSHPVMAGYKPGGLEMDLLTTRPSSCVTYPDGMEPVFAMRVAGAALKAELRFIDGKTDVLQLVPPASDGAELIYHDCSYSSLRETAAKAGHIEDITGWEVYYEGSARGKGVKFSVAHGRHYQYVFRNALGTYDTIYATGEKSRSIDSEVRTFVNAGQETELDNDAIIVFEQNSGYVAGIGKAKSWTEFLSSTERYIVENGTLRRIVVEDDDMGLVEGELSSLKFRWHYADLYSQWQYVREPSSPDAPGTDPGEGEGGGSETPGEGGGGTSATGKTYTVTSNPMTITHNLNRLPSVTVVDPDFNEVVAAVAYPSLNEVKVEWNPAGTNVGGFIYIV